MLLIAKAKEKETEERLHRQWTAQLPLMAYADKYMPFSEYYDKNTGRNIDMRPASEILKEIEAVEKRMEGGKAKNGT